MGRLSLVGIPRTGARGALNIFVAAAAIAAAFTAPPVRAGAAQDGTLTVIVRSTAAGRAPLRVGIDQQICGDSVPDESVLMTRGLVTNAVVSVPGLPGTHPASIEVANDKCRFAPHAALAAPGAAVRMVSHDATLHTVHAQHQGKSLFNVGLPVPNIAVSRPARGNGPVLLRCNTHPWMSGVVYLTADRAVLTGVDGVATFNSMPAGTHRIAVWHEALGTVTGTATIAAGRTTSLELTLPGK